MKFANLIEMEIEDYAIEDFIPESNQVFDEITKKYNSENKNNIDNLLVFSDIILKSDRNKVLDYFKKILSPDLSLDDHINTYDDLIKRCNEKNRIVNSKDMNTILFITSYINKKGEPTDDLYNYDVSGIKIDDYTNTWALEFSPWNEWLNFYVVPENLNDFSIEEFVAAAIFEMTFCGYSDEEIADSPTKAIIDEFAPLDKESRALKFSDLKLYCEL